MKNYCYWPSLRISFVWSAVFGNFRFWKWTVPSTLNFCIFNLRRPSGGLFIFFIRFIQIFIGVLFSYYNTNEKRNKWTLITQLKYDWSLNKFDLPLSPLFGRNRISSRGEEVIWFLAFRLIFLHTSSSLLFSVLFSNVSRNSTRKEILLYLVSFCPPKSINSFLYIQFLGFRWTFCCVVLKETEEIIFFAFVSVLHINLRSFC